MLGPLILLFTLLPAIEFYLLFKIGSQIGALETFYLIIFTGIAGAYLAKREGLSILNKIQGELNGGGLPTNAMMNGLMVFGGGLLLLTPGFLTDILGFSMVLPGSRHLMIMFAKRYFEYAIKSGNIHIVRGGGFTYQSGGPSPFERPESGPRKVDGDTFETDFKNID